VHQHLEPTYVVGIDFGTLSGRAVVVRAGDGTELASAVHEYADAVIERTLPSTGHRLPPDWALQNPDDWLEVLRRAVPAAIAAADVDPAAIIGIGTAFTACTVLPVLRDGTPLCQLDDLRDRPHAWPKLWKHHAAQSQADRINALAHERREPWIDRYGGRISSEWQFAKALQVLAEDPEVYDRAERWIEAADWIIWQLCGRETRNACTAGYKGIYQDGEYPSAEFLGALDPRFADFAQTRLAMPLLPLGAVAGTLTAAAASRTGLIEGITVAAGNVDAHVTAPAVGAVDDGALLAIMGTSTCHVVSAPDLVPVPGICGVVDGGIVTGSYGYEAGQSAVGDIFGWWARLTGSTHAELSVDAPVGAHGLIALDWMGGNRSILVDHDLSGVILGATLATTADEVYRALIEATAYGTRIIIEAFEAAGVPINRFVVAGGLKNNPMLMQVYADILRRPVDTAVSDQAPALGAAIHAAVAAGAYEDVRAASAVMGRVIPGAFVPDERRADAYDRLYAEYRALHDHFGASGSVLHRLRRIRNEARS
jgi:L-ribulokinase